MTLSDQDHSPSASLFKCDFSYNCAATNKISTDIARRAFPRSAIAEIVHFGSPSQAAQ